MVAINVRLFRFPTPKTEAHTFLVNAPLGGMSHVLGSIDVDPRETSFRQARTLIELVQNEEGIWRRTLLFHEARSLMEHAFNFHDRPEEEKYQYRVGYALKEDLREESGVPTVLREEDEDETFFNMMEGEFWKYDLIMIPLTQLPVEEREEKEES